MQTDNHDDEYVCTQCYYLVDITNLKECCKNDGQKININIEK